jgi:hypothetical protein
MKAVTLAATLAGVAVILTQAQAQDAQSPAARAKDVPLTVEYYYRVKWGSLKEFAALYEKNHAPLLEEAKKAGFVTEMKTQYPFTHLAGGPRWDMRVTITYRDAAAAINDPAWEEVWVTAKKRLYKDLKKFDAEEAHRFSLLEDHWDVIVADYPG